MEAPPLPERIAAARWYHSIELPGGIVTPGEYDLPDAIRRIPFPSSLRGKRCLDVGTRDGFWAFAMEARGADEVLGIDLDDPAGYDYSAPAPPLAPAVREEIDRRNSAFQVAHGALGSAVTRRDLSVYRLSPEEVGQFDFAFIGTLLLHLRDPVGALAAIRRVLAPGATLITNEPISIPFSVLGRVAAVQPLMWPGLPFWWLPNLAARRKMVAAAGYEIRQAGRPYLMRYGRGWEHAPDSLAPRNLIRTRWSAGARCTTASSPPRTATALETVERALGLKRDAGVAASSPCAPSSSSRAVERFRARDSRARPRSERRCQGRSPSRLESQRSLRTLRRTYRHARRGGAAGEAQVGGEQRLGGPECERCIERVGR